MGKKCLIDGIVLSLKGRKGLREKRIDVGLSKLVLRTSSGTSFVLFFSGRSFLVCNSHLERNIIFCSEGFTLMFGFTKAEVLGNRTAKGTCDFLKVSSSS